jgi:hypothetical protein
VTQPAQHQQQHKQQQHRSSFSTEGVCTLAIAQSSCNYCLNALVAALVTIQQLELVQSHLPLPKTYLKGTGALIPVQIYSAPDICHESPLIKINRKRQCTQFCSSMEQEGVSIKVAGALKGAVRVASFDVTAGELRAEVARLLGEHVRPAAGHTA